MNFETQIIRIEYKLNMIIEALQSAGLMVKDLPNLVGIQEDNCPVCTKPNILTADYDSEQVHLTCDCSLPLTITKGISQLMEAPDASTSKRNVPEPGTRTISPNITQESPSDR